MTRKILFILSFMLLTASCATRLVPVESVISKKSHGIIVTVGKQNITFYKDDLYTPVYLIIANNTDKKVKIDYTNFMLADDQGNQFASVPLEKVRKESKKKQEQSEQFSCPPSCYPYQIPYGYSGVYPYTPGNYPYNPYYSSLYYPYLSTDPYLYYKDKNDNYQIVPPTPIPYLQTFPAEIQETDPQLLALKMEEIYPHFQLQGYLYFHQGTRLAKERVKLLVHIPGYTEKPLEFEFIIK